MNQTQSKPIAILLDNNAHRYARQFASEQVNPAKGKQVYLNTLAVYGVHTYLKCLNINSNLADSDCWQKVLRAMFNVADLGLPQGKLEFCWLLTEGSAVTIPLEAREERLGYIIVRLEAELKQIELLGFIPGKAVNYDTETINIDRLRPLEALLEAIATPQPATTNLSQWLSAVFTSEWQPIETVLAGRITRSLATANPNVTSITRGKVIQWQLNSLDCEIILVLQIREESNRAIALCLQLYPGVENDNLPPGLSVSILDKGDRLCLSATTKDTDDWMQLEFDCQQGEEFKVQMDLAGVSIVEQFIV